MAYQKKLVDSSREELLEVLWQLIGVVARKSNSDLQPNRTANRRHQYHKRVWGKKKLAMVGLLHKAVAHCPPDLAKEIQYVLDIEENHYQKRDAKTQRMLRAGHPRKEQAEVAV